MKIVVRSFSRLFFSSPRSRIYTAACTIDSLRRATLERIRSTLTDGTNYYRYYTPQITRTFLTESSSFLFFPDNDDDDCGQWRPLGTAEEPEQRAKRNEKFHRLYASVTLPPVLSRRPLFERSVMPLLWFFVFLYERKRDWS